MFAHILALVSALGVSAWYLYHWEVFFNSDFAMVGLIGSRMLETGEVYLYVPKVGYQGLLVEGYLSALFFHLFGMTPRVLHSVSLLMWLVFCGVFYLSVKEWFNKRVAAFSVFLLSCASPLFFANVLRTQPNYPETYALGCFLFWAFKKFIDTGNKKYFLLGSFAGGFGWYLYGQIIYFLISIFVVWVICKLKRFSLVSIWRSRKLNLLLIVGIVVSLLPSLKFSQIKLPGPSLGVLCVLIWTGTLLITVSKPLLSWFSRNKKALVQASVVFVLGYSPNLYHRFIQGRFAKSGIKLVKFSEEIWLNLKIILFHLDDFIVGSEFKFVSVSLTLFALGTYFVVVFSDVKKNNPKWINPFWVLGAVVFLGFISSRSVNEPFSLRYVLCFHLALAISLSCLIESPWVLPNKKVSLALLSLWVAIGAFSNFRAPQVFKRTPLYPQLTQWGDIKPVVEYLRQQNLPHGYGDYWISYLAQFVTKGEIFLEPIYSGYLSFYEGMFKETSRIVLVTKKDPDFELTKVRVHPEKIEISQVFYQVRNKKDLDSWQIWDLERL